MRLRTQRWTIIWLLAPLVVLSGMSYAAQGASAGPAGRLAFVQGSGEGSALFRIGADGQGMMRLTFGQDEEPAWSAVGSRVAFSRTRDRGRSYEIYVVSATGGRVRAITSSGGLAQSPSWAPDGSRIVFNASGGRFGRSTDPSCAPNLWTVRPDGSGLRRLLRAGTQPAYSPDGRRLAFVRPDRSERPWVYVVGVNGTRLRRLGIGLHPSWSPDGQRLVVARPMGANRISDLWSLRVSDGRATRLTRTARVSELDPAWSPDGHWIAFSAVRNDRQDIYALPASGGTARAITHSPRGAGDFQPTWQPRSWTGRSAIEGKRP